MNERKIYYVSYKTLFGRGVTSYQAIHAQHAIWQHLAIFPQSEIEDSSPFEPPLDVQQETGHDCETTPATPPTV